MSRIGAIVQARMGSRRLPGKVLRPVAGKPLLEYLLERLERCDALDKLIVATSTDPEDDPIAAYCAARGTACLRGPHGDVAGRFLEVLDRYPLDAFVRISADSPFLDPELVRRAVRIYREASPDLVTNVRVRTYPRGQSVEVVSAEVFRRAYPEMQTPEDREHVTGYFYRNAAAYRILAFDSPVNHAHVRLVVDTSEDLAVIERMVARMDRPHWEYNLDALLKLYHEVVDKKSG